MKLLLTSNGLSNDSIAAELFRLVGKPAAETKIAFIPTAMNVARGDKDWFVNDLGNIVRQGLKGFDIVDISALPKNIWLPRLESADVLFFSGGNNYYLMHWLKESGLVELLPEMLKTKVYAGISAGSVVVSPNLTLSSTERKEYYEANFGQASEEALNLVDFYVRPHYNAHGRVHASRQYVEEIAKDIPGVIYAIDDMSAVSWVDGELKIASEGEYLILNQKS